MFNEVEVVESVCSGVAMFVVQTSVKPTPTKFSINVVVNDGVAVTMPPDLKVK